MAVDSRDIVPRNEFLFCGKGRMNASFLQVDSLNLRAYSYRYKDLYVSEQMAKEAYLWQEIIRRVRRKL